MDGYFLRDDDIIGENSGEYKPFDLAVEDWKVSPTTDFTLESPELNFSTENLLDRATLEKEFKQEKLEDCSSDSWFSVLNTKGSWSAETKSKKEGYLNEQVVPDQGQVMDMADQKNKSVSIQEIQNTLVETSKGSYTKNNCSPLEISTNVIMDSPLEQAIRADNSSNSLLICDHKEQVNNEKESFELPPANVLFTFDPLCDTKNVEDSTENILRERTSPETIKITEGESLPGCIQATLSSEQNNLLKTENGGFCSTNASEQPAANVETIRNLEIKLEKSKTEHADCEESSKENEVFKIRKKFIKLLTATKLPKCTMVDYKFANSNKLPSFAETFCPGMSEVQSKTQRDVELPTVLENVNKVTAKDEEMFILLPESESESECSEIEQEDEIHQNHEQDSLGLESLDSKELSKINIKSEVIENESEITNKTQKTQNADTPSSMLAIDDELEKFLFSSIVLNETSHSNNSQLPDLSNNIGSILRSEGLAEESSMESVYGNLFSKSELSIDGIKSCKQEHIADQNLKITETYQGNIFNAALLGAERTWNEQVSAENTLYGSVWPRSVPNEAYVNQMSSRHFTNNMFHASDPFLNNTDFKAMSSLPTNIMQTETADPFKFTNTVQKVEVVDSSFNYGF